MIGTLQMIDKLQASVKAKHGWKWVNNGYTFSRVIHKTPELSTKFQKSWKKYDHFVTGITL